MNIVIDAGNTTIKAGVFDGNSLIQKEVFTSANDLVLFLKNIAIENILISSVATNLDSAISTLKVAGEKILLTSKLFLPVRNLYATPETLGVDRIAAACGAWLLYPQQSSLVIDIGTCINYEFVNDQGDYLGGAISPGVKMRFESMNKFTANLPLATPVDEAVLIGNSTVSCLQTGVMNGVLEEIKGMIARYQHEYPTTKVILCGGDAHFFEKHLNPSIFVAPEVVLMGLNSILLYNVKS